MPSHSVSTKDLAVFCRQLSTLVSTGIPLIKGLGILERQSKNPALKDAVAKVRADIEAGLSIAEAMKRHPAIFPTLVVSMVKAGEVGGILDTILDRLSGYLEAAEALRSKVRSAMMYPMIVLFICGAVTLSLLAFVIPRFQAIFADFNCPLPALTQLLIDVSGFIRKYFPLLAAACAGGVYAFKRWYEKPSGREQVDARLLKLPLFGSLLLKTAIARFGRTLGTLLRSGVPIVQALETVADTAGNVIVARAILATRDAIKEGGHLAPPLEKSGLFPEMTTSMIAVGEETGSLDAMLAKIADTYDQEIDADIKGLTSLIEPIVIVVMGVVVGTIVLAMFMGIFGINDCAGK